MSSVDPPATLAPAVTTSEAKKKKKSRSEKRAAAAKANPHERTKTVVRRLPPNLPEEVFWQSVQQWVSDDTVVWKSFEQGKLRKKCVYLVLAYGLIWSCGEGLTGFLVCEG